MPTGTLAAYRWPTCQQCSTVFLQGRTGRTPKHCGACRPEVRRQRFRRNWLRAQYGLTPERYDEMFVAQQGLCAACSIPAAEALGEILHVDHCHETGAVRGLLCFKCNTGLGHLGDTEAAIQRVLDYLRTPNGT